MNAESILLHQNLHSPVRTSTPTEERKEIEFRRVPWRQPIGRDSPGPGGLQKLPSDSSVADSEEPGDDELFTEVPKSSDK